MGIHRPERKKSFHSLFDKKKKEKEGMPLSSARRAEAKEKESAISSRKKGPQGPPTTGTKARGF